MSLFNSNFNNDVAPHLIGIKAGNYLTFSTSGDVITIVGDQIGTKSDTSLLNSYMGTNNNKLGTKADIVLLDSYMGTVTGSPLLAETDISFGTVGKNIYISSFGDGTPWKIPPDVFTIDSISVGSEDDTPNAAYISPDGGTLMVCGGSNSKIFSYRLTTRWDITTATYVESFDHSGDFLNAVGISFDPTGQKMYILSGASSYLYQYNLQSPYYFGTPPNQVGSYDASGLSGSVTGLWMDDTGSYVNIVSGTYVYYGLFMTPWELNSLNMAPSFPLDVSASDATPKGVWVEKSMGGTHRVWVLGATSGAVYEYQCPTWFDYGGATLNGSFDITDHFATPTGLYFSPTGTKMIICSDTTDLVYQYNLTEKDNSINSQGTTVDTYTVNLYDSGRIVTFLSETGSTSYIPLNATVPFPVGSKIQFIQLDAASVRVEGVSGVLVNGVDAGTVDSAGQFKEVTAVCRSADDWLVY